MNQQIRYVTPDKVYVVYDRDGMPSMVVQNRKMAEFFSTVDGGGWKLVEWYPMEKFLKDFAPVEKTVTYDNYEPSFKNPGSYVYRPLRKRYFDD